MTSREPSPTHNAAVPESPAPMVDRIALRLWMQEVMGIETDFYRQSGEIQRYWRDAARIAIEAMQEPTPEMVGAYYELQRIAPGTETWAMAGIPSAAAVCKAMASAAIHGPQVEREGSREASQ